MPYSNDVLVTYYECDASVKIKISSLVRHMMNAATDHANMLDIGYDVLSSKDMAFLLAKNCIEIKRLPAVDEKLKISTVMTGCKGAKFIREIVVDDEQGNRCLNSLTIWMIVNLSTRKILRPSVLDIDSLPIESPISDIEIADQRFPKDFVGELINSKTVRAEYSYIDSNKHVNNSYYLDFICDALPYDELVNRGLKSIQLAYINEIIPQTEVNLKVYKTEVANEYHLVSKDDNHKFFEAIVKLND